MTTAQPQRRSDRLMVFASDEVGLFAHLLSEIHIAGSAVDIAGRTRSGFVLGEHHRARLPIKPGAHHAGALTAAFKVSCHHVGFGVEHFHELRNRAGRNSVFSVLRPRVVYTPVEAAILADRTERTALLFLNQLCITLVPAREDLVQWLLF
jgi:hypothetical protein